MFLLRLSRHKVIAPLFFLLVLVYPAFVKAQGADISLILGKPDTSRFPDISFNLVALDSQGDVIANLDALSITEDRVPITEFDLQPAPVGAEVIFVIDANESIEDIDEAGGLTRREKVRDSILRFANRFMDPAQNDPVSIIVPDDATGRFLDKAGMVFPNEVMNAINFYETGELSPTPLNRMIQVAFERAEENLDDGRFNAVVLFTDGAQLEEQLDYEGLVEQARESNVVVYGAILGSFADQEEIENVTRLTGPTGGFHIHLRQPETGDDLYRSIQERATQVQISYRSILNTSGMHQIRAELDSAQGESSFEIEVEPPEIAISIDNSKPIRRVAEAVETPLREMVPADQPLIAQVLWPDGYPRMLKSVALRVNGAETEVARSVLDTSGVLTFDWDISLLDEGIYQLEVVVEDELGLRGESPPLPLIIEVDRPQPAPTATTPPPTPVPTPTIVPEPQVPLLDILDENAAWIIVGGLLVLLFLIGLVMFFFFIRRPADKGSEDEADEIPNTIMAPPPLVDRDPGATTVIPPNFALEEPGMAFLEVLENAPEHADIIPLSGGNMAMGRDQRAVQIHFSNRSVSRLHARIVESQGTFRIIDEGSSSGTFVNFKRIGLTPRVLQDKDDIHLGRVHLRFHHHTADIETTKYK